MAEGGWISKYGVPGLIVSIAAITIQQQQQIFDRLRDSVQSGYQFYSSNRTDLGSSSDPLREESLLKITGRVFPNIYCEVRQDMYERTNAAQAGIGFTPDNPAALTSRDLSDMRDVLTRSARPERPLLPENLIDALRHPWSGARHECDALNEATTVVAEADTTEAAAPADAVTDSAAPPPPAASPSSSAGEARLRFPTGSLQGAPVSMVAGGPPHLDPLPSEMRVFFQIPLASRDRSVIDAPLDDLEQFNYRVMRGVERVSSRGFTLGGRTATVSGASASEGAEVRYFGPEEEHAAAQLAAYLDYQFRNEHLHFTPRAIGGAYPGMPRENLEVWVPPRAGAAQ